MTIVIHSHTIGTIFTKKLSYILNSNKDSLLLRNDSPDDKKRLEIHRTVIVALEYRTQVVVVDTLSLKI